MPVMKKCLGWGGLGLLLLLGHAGCAVPIVHARPDLAAMTQQVNAVVLIPPRLGYGKLAEQRRVGRVAGDLTIQFTGGRAILAEELPGTDPEMIVAGVRGVGEDPSRTLVFSIIAARDERKETNGALSGSGLRRSQIFVDFTVRLDVRSAQTNEILGTVETFSTALATSPNFDAEGRPLGVGQAIGDAIAEGIRQFAPRLVQPEGASPFGVLAEAPQPRDEDGAGTLPAIEKLRRLRVLYPDVNEADLTALASSSARFLVVAPRGLSTLGLEPGDLISGMGGRNLGSRGALARHLAAGNTPAMSIDRKTGRFLIGQTLVARAR